MINKVLIVNNLKVNYLVSENFNNDEAIVFLHGWKSPADLFLRAIGNIDNILAFSLPGFNGSDRPQETWGLEEYSSFLNDFFQKLNFKNPTLVGHSFGGSVAVKYAIAYPDNFKKLILISPAIIRKKTLKIKGLYILSKTAKFLFPGLANLYREKFYKKINSTDYLEAGNMADIYQKIIRQDVGVDLLKIEKPVILIWGENDDATPLDEISDLVKNSNHIKLYPIKNAGHYSFLDNQGEFKKIFFENL